MTKELSNKDRKRLLYLWQKNHDEEALTLLISSNMGLVVYLANKYSKSKTIPFDDLVSTGKEGLLKALNKYDLKREERAISFSSYLTVSIENQIRMEIRKQNKHKKTISLEKPVYIDEKGNNILIKDMIGTNKDQLFNDVADKFKTIVINEVLNVLNDREKQIILLRYGLNDIECKTQKEIANLFNCSQAGICRQEQRALTKMRRPRHAKKIKDFIN